MFGRRMIRRGVRRTVSRSFRFLTRGAILGMAGVAGGVTLAAIASRENVSKEDAEEMMDELVADGTLRKETRNGETVYVSANATAQPTQIQSTPQPQQMAAPAAVAGATKFCRQCGAKIALDSKFCEKCGAQL
jgi:ribosomal protein L40E